MPVVKKKGKLVGIITRSDIRQAEPSDATTLNVWEINYLLARLQVKDILTKKVMKLHIQKFQKMRLKSIALLLTQRKSGMGLITILCPLIIQLI